MLDLEALVLHALFLPGPCTHLSQRPASLFAYVFCAMLEVTASRHLRVKLSCIYRPPACPARPPSIQAFRVKASYSLHPRAGENKPVACGASAPICHPLHSALALGFSSVWYLSFPWLLQLGSGLTLESRVLALAFGIILHVVSIYFCCHLFLTQRSFL